MNFGRPFQDQVPCSVACALGLALILLLATSSGQADAGGPVSGPKPRQGYRLMDPIGDVHLNFPTCQEQGIDMTKVSFEVVGDQIQAQIDVTKPIFEQWGYREYYIWIDVDPSQRKGYQPYFPHSVAWENFHADYRMFFSLNQPLNQKQPVFVRGVQDCSESNCENEVGLHNPQQQFQVEVKGSRVLFRAPLALFPNWGKEPSFQLAATTYFQLHTCNGEDDAPQWGELTKRIRIQDVTNPKP